MSITARIDAITNIPEDYRHARVPCPRSVKIELTAKCNFRCSFCAQAKDLREKGEIDKEFFKDILLEMREAGVEEIGLFYLGESFMVDWLPEAIAYAKKTGFPYVFLTTNGSLCTPERVRECMEAGLDSLKFSFNYADAEQMHEIANVTPRFFERMIANIQSAYEIREEGFDCGLYASYIAYDGEQGEKMVEALKRIEPFIDEAYALPLYTQGDLVSDDLDDWEPKAGNPGRLGALREPIPCWAVATEGHITYDGKLSACCFGHTDDLTMADLNKSHFMDGWNSEKFQSLRAAHMSGSVKGTPCEACLAYDV